MANISVIIPTKNGEKSIGQLLTSLEQQSTKPSQVMIIDSSSEDDTVNICNAFDVDVVQINARNFNHGGTRNLAASRATGNILLYLTQDVLLKDPKCVENLLKPLLEDSEVAAAYSRQIPREDSKPIERFTRSFNYPSEKKIKGIEDLADLGIKTFFFSNACSAIRRNVFEEVGGFPENTIVNEDMFLAAKLLQKGYKIAYQAEAIVCHSHDYSLMEMFKRYFDIGVFFNRNNWIVEIAKTEVEGIKYTKELMHFLAVNKQWVWLPYAVAETGARFLGYKVGLMEEYLPIWIKEKISNNKCFWNV